MRVDVSHDEQIVLLQQSSLYGSMASSLHRVQKKFLGNPEDGRDLQILA